MWPKVEAGWDEVMVIRKSFIVKKWGREFNNARYIIRILISSLIVSSCYKNNKTSICNTMTTKNVKKSTRSLDENEMQLKKIGNHLKQLRLKASYTAAETFANEHEIHRAQYTRYERGMDMRLSSLMKVLAAHEMTLAEFFKGI